MKFSFSGAGGASRRRGRRGQAALEYVFVFVLLLGLIFALERLFHVSRHVSRRTAILVGSENS